MKTLRKIKFSAPVNIFNPVRVCLTVNVNTQFHMCGQSVLLRFNNFLFENS